MFLIVMKNLAKLGKLILGRDQEAEMDIERFKGLSNNQDKNIKSTLRRNREMLIGPLWPVEVSDHHTNLKLIVITKKPKTNSISIANKKEVDWQVQKLLELSLIEVSNIEIRHLVVCIVKKDATLRLYTNYRALNLVTQIPFLMKDLQEIKYAAGWLNICLIDLLSEYWQIKIAKKCGIAIWQHFQCIMGHINGKLCFSVYQGSYALKGDE